MGIGEQFKGLDMKNLIGGPLTAAADASILLANSTASFINQVGFDSANKVRTVAFKFNKKEPDDDGNLTEMEMLIDVPLLAIVPIPNLQIDEVNITFDMEVKECSKDESSNSKSASLSASGGWCGIKVSVSGSVSSQSSNTRSSDNSAKYHVDVRATNHGTPEGLARVLDMMAASVSPNLLGSRTTDEAGAELTGARRERSQKLKAIREKTMQLEKAERAAADTKESRISSFVRRVNNIQSVAKSEFSSKLTSASEEEKKKLDPGIVDDFWKEILSSAEEKVSAAAASGKSDNPVTKFCPPPDETHKLFTDAADADNEFKTAVQAYIEWANSQKAVEESKVEYNNVMMGTAAVPA
ncbi:MAG: DUF2589 domain-containing protein [Chitinispirillales bacterium]|jgi:hypothetical protein|nr:DUF2589 domain-containing protein [Chitinispirillales bacterium]